MSSDAREAAISELARLLADLPGFADVHTRAVMLDDLPSRLIAGLAPLHPSRAVAASQLIRYLQQWDGALLELAELLVVFHGESDPVKRFQHLVARVAESSGAISVQGGELVRILRDDPRVPWLPSYLEVTGRVADPPPDSPDEAVVLLEDLAAPPHQAPPVLRFAAAVAARAGLHPGTREDLLEWAERFARRLGVPVPRAPHPGQEASYGGRDGGVRLVVRLKNYQPGSPDCMLAVWLHHGEGRWIPLAVDDEPQPPSRIAARFGTFLKTAEDYAGGPPSRVEFMLPRSLLDLPVDRWAVRRREGTGDVDLPLGALCPVVVRDLERPDDPWVRERWARRWREYEDLHDLPAERAAWVSLGHDRSPVTTVEQLERALAVVVEPPPRHSRARLGSVARTVETALDAGVPVVLWGRDESDADGCVDSGALRAAVRYLMSRGSPGRLPERITSLRKEAFYSGEPSPADQLALVWDGPEGRLEVDGGALRSL
ncbi:VMAP-C domain-containing protein [Streptomyces sp. MS191]|uniref:VMAP-C domain-containing protein n=1 Tax=Streptomyces sp. ms191 TaxID=1827978 RepID=UPI0011CE6D99|nr:hypothetical protein [Streptomyces sp. ms191]